MPDVGTELADPQRHGLLVDGMQAQLRRRLQQPQRLLQRRQLIPAVSRTYKPSGTDQQAIRSTNWLHELPRVAQRGPHADAQHRATPGTTADCDTTGGTED